MTPRRKSPPPAPPARRVVLVWLAVSLTVFACLPGMMSGNYLPKTFWAAVTIGLGLVLVSPRRRDELRLTLLGAVWLAYLGWALLSLAWAIQPRVALERWLALLLPTLGYLLARRTRFWESDLFWTGFSAIFALVALIGVLQYFFADIPLIHDIPGTAVPRATMGQRNYAAMYMAVTIFFIARLYFRAPGRRVFLPAAGLLLGSLFLVVARSRGAWLAAAAGSVFFLAAGGGKGLWARRKRLAWLAGPAAAALLLAFTVGPQRGITEDMGRKVDLAGTMKKAVDPSDRLEFWRGTLEITHPLLGAGFGNFPIVATPFDRESKVKTLNWEVHNDYFQAYVDLGIPGAALFSVFVLLLLRLAWKGRSRGVVLAAGAAAVGLAVMQFATFTSEKVSTLIWFAGVAALLNGVREDKPILVLHPPGWTIRGINRLAAAWLLVFAVAVVYTIRGDREFRRGRDEIARAIYCQEIADHPERYSAREVEWARGAGQYDRARVIERLRWLAGRLLPSVPFDANMRHITCHQFAGLAMGLRDAEAAATFARAALELHPNDRICLFYLCQLSLMNGDYTRAWELLMKGVETFGYNPYQPHFAENLIGVYEKLGYPERAREVREKLEANRVISPLLLFPPTRTADVPIDARFDWEDCPGALSYDFYLWRVGEDTPPGPHCSGLDASEVRLRRPLQPGTTYLWRVWAVGRYGREESRIWFFRTAAAPGQKPVDFSADAVNLLETGKGG